MDMSRAFDLWVEITGVNPSDTYIRLRDMDIRRANDVLKKSLVHDKTYVTTMMLLKMYLEDFLADRQLSMKEILDNFDVFNDWIMKINEFKTIIESEDVLEIKAEFKDLLKQGLAHYGANPQVYVDMVENESNLAELRYSVFNAIDTLEVAQFTDGLPISKKPVLYKDLYVFKDLNTLLKWMLAVDSGIVLAMIQDIKDQSNSYFVFAVRNGGRLYLVTDREKTSHPLRQELSRSRARGREFFNRITEYHFPYSILDIDFGDNNRAYISHSSETALVSKEDGLAIKAIKDMESEEVLWLMMMFSLLEEKFFAQEYKADKLSYTAQMMEETTLLLEQAKKNEVAVLSYTKLEVPPMKVEDINTAEKVKDAFEHEPTGQHDWMIERYSIPQEAIDVVTNKEKPVLLLTDGRENRSETSIALKKMDMSSFDDAERLEKDRIYLARYNMAMVINQQLKEEYEKRKNEVINWFKTAVKKNLPALLKAISEGKMIVTDIEEARTRDGGAERLKTNGNILRVGMLKDESFYGFTHCHIYGDSTEFYRGKTTCAVNDKQATLIGHFFPRTASQLAELCGCEISELHELLQNWQREREDRGNSILDSVDPMDWAIHNPWKDVRFDVRIYLSKTGFNQLCKENQTNNENFWKKEVVE